MTDILIQAFHAARESPQALRAALGAAIDLLVWIPKIEGDVSVAAQRPLQLLTCLRRLFGAALAEVTGPVVERGLSPAAGCQEGRQLQPQH